MAERSVRRAPRHRLVLVTSGMMLLAACSASVSPSLSDPPNPSPTPSPSATPSPTAEPTLEALVTGPDTLAVEEVATGFVNPTGLANAGDGSGRLFVLSREGAVRAVDADGTIASDVFLDLSDRVLAGGERGLLGLAFHPDYEQNGRFFVAYTSRPDGANTISEFRVSPQPGRADPTSERVLIAVPDPAANHNGGSLAFGPDGFLYISMGDGGGQGDQFRNGQNVNALLGKILRIDVDGPAASGRAYAIPPDNPFATGGGAPEIWAYGLRNPWRISFDRALGALLIGDVGGGAWEEVNYQAPDAPGGRNYGWPIMEGRHCTGGTSCSTGGLVQPMVEYDHSLGCSVIGGYVYRGSAQPMNGAYVFADYCSGIVFTLVIDGVTATYRQVLNSGLGVSAFGEDEAGELYLVDFDGGGLYRVVVP